MRTLIILPLIAWLPRPATPSSARSALPGHVVDVIARDFFLQAPDTIPAGLTTLRLRVPQGNHIAVLVRLDSGHTAADLLRARRDGQSRPAWMHFVGGPGFPAPGGTANATMVLTPGRYVLLCDVADSDGVHHVEKGMFHPLVVRPAVGTPRAESPPRPDVVVTMRDYAFHFSKPPRAGTRVLRVVNDGTVMHEFRVTRVLPGHTVREALAWTPDRRTPRPDEDVTALVAVMPGAALATTVDLTAGDYLVFCVAQIAHGMMRVLHVPPAAVPERSID